MPFQALPIAFRTNTGNATSKLAWIYVVQHCSIDDAPNGMAWLEAEVREIAAFCQCDASEAVAALKHLERCGLVDVVRWKSWEDGGEPDEAFIDVTLPMSSLGQEERKRIKASPDEVDFLRREQSYRCVTCGVRDISAEVGDWHVDHIIPRSLGGADVAGNCQVICATCNSRKGARIHFVDFLGGRRR